VSTQTLACGCVVDEYQLLISCSDEHSPTYAGDQAEMVFEHNDSCITASALASDHARCQCTCHDEEEDRLEFQTRLGLTRMHEGLCAWLVGGICDCAGPALPPLDLDERGGP